MTGPERDTAFQKVARFPEAHGTVAGSDQLRKIMMTQLKMAGWRVPGTAVYSQWFGITVFRG